MSWNWKHVLARAAALASVGLVAATLAWAQTGSSGPASGSTAPPSTGGSPTGGTRSPSTGNPIGGSNIDTAEGETPDATRPGVSASQPPRLGSSGTVPGIGTRSRTRSYDDDSDTDATFDAESATRSARQFEQDEADGFRDAARETRSDARQSARDTRSEARERADEFRDAARETSRDTREFSRDTAEDARERADEFRDEARDTTRDAREFSRDTRREARDTADDFREATRDTDRFEDRRFRDSDRFRDSQFDRDSDRFTDREFRDEDRFTDRQFDRDSDRMLDRDRQRLTERDAFQDREDRFSSERSSVTRDDRFGSDSRFRTSSDFRVDNIRSADIGLWFDTRSRDGLVINDLGTGAISRWGFREGDRIYSVNGVRVDSERAFLTSLFDPRWRDERVSVVIYRHGRPWTVYVYPSQLVTEYTTVATVDPLEQYGLILDDRYDDYVVVWRVLPRSPAYYAGLRPGDVITTFDNRRLTGRDDFVGWISRGNLDSVALGINRNRQSRLVDLDLSQGGTFSSSTTTGISGSRTSLRPDLDAAGRFDGTLDGRLEGASGAQFDSRTDTRFDTRSGTQLDGRTDTQFESRMRTPTGTIPNRLRGSADAAIDADAGAIQPGTIRGTTSDGIQGTVQPRGVLPRVGGAIQGGVRGGGLFRGNR